MYAILFPTRLKFTRLPYKLEWAEADARLTRITKDAFDTEIEKLGGKPILDQLRAAHLTYGETLGITAEGQDPNTTGLRKPLQTFTKTLRAYVLAVAAHADPDDTASIELTDTLLAPLQTWQSHIAEPAAPTPPVPTPPAPAPTPAPAPGNRQAAV